MHVSQAELLTHFLPGFVMLHPNFVPENTHMCCTQVHIRSDAHGQQPLGFLQRGNNIKLLLSTFAAEGRSNYS